MACGHADAELETICTVCSIDFQVRLFGNWAFKIQFCNVSQKILNFQYLISFCFVLYFSDNHRRHCLLSICIFCTIYKSRLWFLKFFVIAKEQGLEAWSRYPCAFLYIMYRIIVKQALKRRHWTFYIRWFTGLTHLWTASAVEICLLSGLFILWWLLPRWDLLGFLAFWTWLRWVLRTCAPKYWDFLFFPLYTWPLSCVFKSWFLRLLKADRLVPCCFTEGVKEKIAGFHLQGLRFQGVPKAG